MHPCANNCGARVFKTYKLCQKCDRARRRTEMSENPVRLRHGYAKKEHGVSGLSVSPEYYVWSSMHQRCTNPKAGQYEDYGGRGIKVCERWDLFDNFLADMGPRPEGKHPSGRAMYTLERKEGDKDYGPDNCIWATYKAQSLNKRSGRIVTYLGETLPLAVFVDRTGLDYKIVHQRIVRGWTVDRALKEPHKGCRDRRRMKNVESK
jgi:hypothetical protein